MHALQQMSRQRRSRTGLQKFFQLHEANTEAVKRELHAGLSADQATISPKYLYDPLGSSLFEAICELPEYYPTRTESGILESCLPELASIVPRGAALIDLGAGNCRKAARLFDVLHPAQYVPVDISVDFLRQSVGSLAYRFPWIDMIGVGMDFSSELNLPMEVRKTGRLFFYPGSSIGNYTPEAALSLLRNIHDACDGTGSLLIGVDLVKDDAILHPAYSDGLGVTAAFNLNLLLHVNRLMHADFRLPDWRHHSFFNAAQGRIEMHLVACRPTSVTWQHGERVFQEGESIHTENSYKYHPEDFTRLLTDAGFRQVRTWTDPNGWFLVCHAAP